MIYKNLDVFCTWSRNLRENLNYALILSTLAYENHDNLECFVSLHQDDEDF